MLELFLTASKDVFMIERSVFTFFDLLGNVGGLYGILLSIAASLNNFFNFQKTENYLAQFLYTGKDSKDSLKAKD